MKQICKNQFISMKSSILLFVIILLCTIGLTACSSTVPAASNSTEPGHPYTKLCGYGRDRVNIMIYFYGSDLEDISHMASRDIQEIQGNSFSDNVRVFIQTDGGRNWDKSVIDASNEVVQRFMISKNGTELIEANLCPVDYDVRESLEWFISHTTNKYPAERNILILWGHGNGSYFWQNDSSLPNGITPKEMDEILSKAGVKFEAIGFDACGMSTLSMINVLSKHADYMIAASTDEPIVGWNYGDWITTLSENTSVEATTYLRQIVDDYITAISEEEKTFDLAVFDLSKSRDFLNSIDQSFIAAYDKHNGNKSSSKGISMNEVLNIMTQEHSDSIIKAAEQMTVTHKFNHSDASKTLGINVTASDINKMRENKE